MPEIVDSMDKIQEGLKMYESGNVLVRNEPLPRAGGKGRPKMGIMLMSGDKEIMLTKAEYDTLVSVQKNVVEKICVNKSMTEPEFAELCRLAVPQLMDRAIQLAMISEDPKEVMAVAKEITDRGYGKVSKGMDAPQTEEADYLRRGWDQFPDRAE